MIHKISRATTYLQTFTIDLYGKHKFQSYATGFFIRNNDELMLVTNWHVVTGINPENPNVLLKDKEPPHYLKLNIFNKKNSLNELTIPLYDSLMKPLWKEHHLGSKVDLAIYFLPKTLEEHFNFIDIKSVEDNTSIVEDIGKEVFIVGYPFYKDELINSFGEDTHYYLPIWKRGSIATEPNLLLGGKAILIDSLSRPGMSGSPIFIAQDKQILNVGTVKNTNLVKQEKDGKISSLDLITQIDPKKFSEKNITQYRFLGVYSGVIGNSRLLEVSLGKCWHFNVLNETLNNPSKGHMPYFTPMINEFYNLFLKEFNGNLVIKNSIGEELRIPLNSPKQLISYSFKP